MQQILILGSEIESCKSLKYAIQDNTKRAYYTLSLENAIRHLIHHRCQLVIIDLAECIANLLHSLNAMRKARMAPILVLSPSGSSEYIEQVLSVADDYLLKPYDIKVCLAKIGALLRRPAHADQQDAPCILSHDGTLMVDVIRRKVFVLDVEVILQRKQYELLYLMSSNEGRVFTREQLQRNVWGDDFIGGENTLNNQIGELRNKLRSVPNAPDYIKTSYGVGYYFDTI